MKDDVTTLAELRNIVRAFIDERDWRQFHTPKNLSMSIAIEAAELMEHFQWVDQGAAAQAPASADLQLIREELADILCYVISFANAQNIDLSSALCDKMRKNEKKYPVDQFRGRYR